MYVEERAAEGRRSKRVRSYGWGLRRQDMQRRRPAAV